MTRASRTVNRRSSRRNTPRRRASGARRATRGRTRAAHTRVSRRTRLLQVITGLLLPVVLAATVWLASALTTAPDVAPPSLTLTRSETREAPPEEPRLQVPSLPRGVVRSSWARDGDDAVMLRPDGSSLTLSLEPNVQTSVEAMLARRRIAAASVVLIEPRTGAVKVYAEHHEDGEPEGDPGVVGGPADARAPTASVFKVVSAAALLAGDVDVDDRICFHGGSNGIREENLRDHRRDRQCESLATSVAHSTNAAFAKWAATRLDEGALANTAEDFHFNRKLPFDVDLDVSPAPRPDSLLARGTLAAGFERGARLSPLHGAAIAAAIANGGLLMRPWLVRADSLQPGLVREPEVLEQVISPEVASALGRAMERTVSEGTARKRFAKRSSVLREMKIAGKTGSLSETRDGVYRHFNWFVGFAPARNPQIAVAVLAVNGRAWRAKAATIARDSLDAWFRDHPVEDDEEAAGSGERG
jgi:cell division protein FtsI/penicillin-binding protein 2